MKNLLFYSTFSEKKKESRAKYKKGQKKHPAKIYINNKTTPIQGVNP